MQPKVSLIIVSWNVCQQLRENLSRLFSLQTREPFEVLVIDNGSTDGTATMIRRSFPCVHLIQNDSNRGFAFACNQGLKMAKGEVLVLFNPDMLIGKGVLDHTYDTLMSQKDLGVMGVKLVRPDQSIVASVRRDPTLKDQLAILLKLPHFFPHLTDHYLAKDFDYSVSQNVEQVRGSFFAFRRDVMEKIGMLDAETFFIWFEEVDYCRRVRQAGYRVSYDASVSCTDLVGQSFKHQSARWKQTKFSLSMARYFRKWHPAWQSVVIYALRPLMICLGTISDLVHLRSRLWK
ncbi:glycosyltransferase family 2 protein [Candidatus Uhrbacteria bacterium]|nr:glycosyltransferase family 2 protein [Candidatus Uhrbacteria bacterium]